MIEVNSVSKRFGSVRALENVSFKVAQGEIVGLLGPNGAGKTTLMRILACFTPPSSGSVFVAGLNVERDSLEIRRRVGYFLERVSIYPEMRVGAFLRFAAGVKGASGVSVKDAVAEVVESCGLADVTGRVIGNLSKGYRQRVGLAQALISRPSVLLLDEPTSGLDPRQVVEIRSLIQGLAGERTVIFSSHILPEVSQICTKIIIIREGRICAVDTAGNLGAQLQQGGTLRVVIETTDTGVADRLKDIVEVADVQSEVSSRSGLQTYLLRAGEDVDLPAALWGLAFEHHWLIREMTPVALSLEEIFLNVVNRDR